MAPEKKQKVIDFLANHYEDVDIVEIGNNLGIKKAIYYSSSKTLQELVHAFMDRVSDREMEEELLQFLKENRDFRRKGLDELLEQIQSVQEEIDVVKENFSAEDKVEGRIKFSSKAPDVYSRLRTGLKAIVIGVERYKYYSKSSYLPGARGDALRVAEFLKSNWKMDDKDIHLFIGGSDGLVNCQETLDEIKRICKEEVGKNNNLLFYYAGHGAEIDGSSYLLLSDFAGHIKEMADNKIKMTDLNAIMKECQAAVTVRVFDCCHSGESIIRDGLTEREIEPVMTNRMLEDFMGKGNGWITFCACNIDESAYDVNERGIFTDALLSGLKGEARRSDGKMYIEDLKIHICNVVPVRAKASVSRHSEYDGEQHPQYKCEIDGNILVD